MIVEVEHNNKRRIQEESYVYVSGFDEQEDEQLIDSVKELEMTENEVKAKLKMFNKTQDCDDDWDLGDVDAAAKELIADIDQDVSEA